MKPLIVYITARDEKEAAGIGNALVKQKLASCVMTIPNLTSQYVWKGRLQNDREVLMMAKTFDTKYPALEKIVKKMHSYETPCIIAIPVAKASKEYISWSKKAVR